MRRDGRVDGQVFAVGPGARDGMDFDSPPEPLGRGSEAQAGRGIVSEEVGEPGGHARASPELAARAASMAESNSAKTGISRTRPVIRNNSRTRSGTPITSGWPRRRRAFHTLLRTAQAPLAI